MKIKRLTPTAKIPTRGSQYAAGWDLYADTEHSIMINPHKTVKIGTGISLEIPTGYWGGIYARSGLATNVGLRPANCTGVIDSDYRGEIIVALHNDTDEVQVINSAERIAQLIFMKIYDCTFEEVTDLKKTERGAGGFGSTGLK